MVWNLAENKLPSGRPAGKGKVNTVLWYAMCANIETGGGQRILNVAYRINDLVWHLEIYELLEI